MSAAAPYAEVPTEAPARLRVAIVAADQATTCRLAALATAAGHSVVVATEAAHAVLTDGSATPALGAPIVALGSAEGDFAGLLPAEAPAAQLDAALRAVAAGLVVRFPAAPTPRFGPVAEEDAPVLTPREVEVLTALADGLSNKAAARRLGISPHTVKFHIEQLFHKLGVGCRAEAVAKGLKQQIVEL